jgi:signal transduction histidine kinase
MLWQYPASICIERKAMFRVTARTILELGSELISSDIIAFYELIKNAFDARSKNGAEIYFNILWRRNHYLQIRNQISTLLAESKERKVSRDSEGMTAFVSRIVSMLESSAEPSARLAFQKAIEGTSSLRELLSKIDSAYATFNSIEVIDTGSGMSLKELGDNFLTIGTPSRKKAVDLALQAGSNAPPYLGEKGIGRLSAMRLGDALRVETARTEDKHLAVLEVDWQQFSDIDAMVEDIAVEAHAGSKKPNIDYHGTKLKIGNLSEDWTEKRVRDMASYDFARLSDPFIDPKNRPRIALFWNGSRINIPWMNDALISNAHASFRGEYLIESGEPKLVVKMEAVNLGYEHPKEIDSVTLTLPDLEGLLSGPHEELPFSALTSVGPFRFEGYWYNRRYLVGIDTIGNLKEVRDLQKKWSGILLFRDNFRVFPYGEDEDDWLGLDRKALARTGYVLNKAQFVGHVNISRARNPNLVDQTNREGLRSTPEQNAFVAILQHIVRDMLWSFFRDMDRKYKRAKVDLGDVKAEIVSLESRAKSALSKVKRFVPKEQGDLFDDLQHAFDEFRDLSLRAQQRIEEVEEDSRQMIQMAGVGLMVEVVAHELARASESALGAIESLRGKEMPSEMRSRLETLRAEMKSVSKRLRVLDELSVSGRQRTEVFDLVEVLNDVKDGHESQFKRHNVSMKIKGQKSPVKIRAVKGMVVQILENLVSNSIYWMDVRSARERRFIPTIEVEVSANPPTIYFTDNGRGISPEHREKVFRPFWSLKEKTKRRGLGLFIARENAQFLGGTLTLSEETDAETGRLHAFILELPQGVIAR